MYTRILLAYFLLLFASTSHATVYSWKEKGVTYYGNTCPPSEMCKIVVLPPAPPPEPTPPPAPAPTILWSAGMEAGNMLEWNGQYNGKDGCKGDGVFTNCPTALDGSYSVASTEQARSGAYSAKLSIPGTGAVRLLRSTESKAYADLVFTTWYFFPQKYVVNSGAGGYTNIQQWKSVTSTSNDPFWLLGYNNGGFEGAMRIHLNWWQPTLEGPQQGQAGKRTFYTTVEIPIGRWFKIEARYLQSSSFNGAVQVWQDGVLIFNMQNVKTNYVDGKISWYVTNYSKYITPSPTVIYVDDVTIFKP